METPEIRLKRLKIRSIRRGIKEMDLLLGQFAETRLALLSEEQLATYEALLDENDQDLLAWVTGQAECPSHLKNLLGQIKMFRP
jgi:antitoxin CptB